MIKNVTVFTRPNCGACIATKTTLDRLGIEYETTDISTDPTAAIDLVEAGFRAMPVVKVKYETGEDDAWSGFKPDMIAALTA